MGEVGERAVVCGAGMAGLLAARVLSEYYARVTLVERDKLQAGPVQRDGVPQGRHFHTLLSAGSQALGALLPGLLDELVAAGATVCDEGDFSRVSIRIGGHELNRSGKFADPASVVIYLASRPFLESHLRRRIRAISNIEVVDGHDAVQPIVGQTNRIIGTRIANRDTGVQRVLSADLVVDAMGRGARTPAFLDGLGCQRPPEQRSIMQGSSSSQFLCIPPDLVGEKMTMVFPRPEQPTGGGLLAYENGTWILTIGRLAGREPPTNLAGLIECAEQFAPRPLVEALKAAEPLSEVSVYRYRGSVWRRYDKIRRLPNGLLVTGDALCSFNPIYGQGMTMAALEAVTLRDCLSHPNGDLGRQFFRAMAQQIRPIWATNQINDLYMSEPGGGRSTLMRVWNWSNDKVLTAAERDPILTERLFRATNLIDPPTRLLDPFLMSRVCLNLWRQRQSQRATYAINHR
ncbi:FAD-dependent oxidoreductase [Mycobacterium kansasii]